MRAIAPLLCLLLAIPATASAEWVRASSYYQFPPIMSESEACQKAEERAEADAIRQITGETLSAEDTMRCSEQGDEAECARNSTIWTMVGGLIRDKRQRQQETTPVIENIRKCTVSFEADVYVAQGQSDPNFTIGVTLNNDVLRDGEKLIVTLKPSQPMAVQIFQWLPYEKGEAQVARIFPNPLDANVRIAKPTTIPTEAGAKRYDLKVGFPAGQPPGRKMVDEYLMVVATRKPTVLRDSYSLDDFNRQIAEIPLSDRRIVRKQYNIVRGSE